MLYTMTAHSKSEKMEKEKELKLGVKVDLGRVSNTLIVYTCNKYQTKKDKQRQSPA